MSNLIRTTVIVPEELLEWAKLTALRLNSSVSQLTRKGLEQLRSNPANLKRKIGAESQNDWRKWAGSLDLGGKEPYKKRSDIYEEHLRRKLSR